MKKIGLIASSILKAFTSFSDNFNRTTTGSLGTSSSGGLWKSLRGIFFTDSKSAKTGDAPNTYPISFVEMSKPDITASISTGTVSVISTSGTVGSIISGPTSGFFQATITGMSSTTGLAVGQWVSATNGTGSLYGGQPDYVEITEIINSTSIKYRTKGGTTPTAGSISNISYRSNDGGSGVSLWITDSGNWWGVSYGRSINNSCNCDTCQTSYCNTYTNYASYYCNGWSTPATYTCNGFSQGTAYSCNAWTDSSACIGWTTGSACSGWTTGSACNSWTTGYQCTAFFPSYGQQCNSWSETFGYQCIGWSSGYSCNQWTSSQQAQCALYQRTGSGWTSGNWICVEYDIVTTYSCIGNGISYSCSSNIPAWNLQCSGGWSYFEGAPGCSQWTTNNPCNGWTTSYQCNQWTATNPCNQWTPTQPCVQWSSSPVFSCSGGYSVSYSVSCSGGYTVNYSPSCSSTTYGYVACNCQTCYPPYIRVIKSSSNAVTEVARWTLGSMAAAIKVVTNSVSKLITIKAYKDSSMTTQIGSDLTHTDNTAIIENKFGIVLSPSDYVQGSQIDDFNIQSN